MNSTKRHWLVDTLLICLLIGSFYSIQLGSRPLSNPDESRYSSVAQTMLDSGNFVTPKVSSVPFLDKPPVYYWLQAAAIKTFGSNTWAIRFFPALIGLFGCLFIYVATRLVFNRRAGLLAATVLASSILYYGAAHYADMNMEVAVFISTTLLFFLFGYHYREKHFSCYLFWLAYIFAGIAFLTKGLIGIAFPIMIIGLWILLTNQWFLLKKMRLFSGLLLFLIIVLPWLLLVQKQNSDFLHYFFIYQQFDRFLTADFNNNQPFWFYIAILFIGLGGWSILAFPSFHLAYRTIKTKQADKHYIFFLVIWALVVLVFFSIPKAKLVGYIMPGLIPLGILIGYYCAGKWQAHTRGTVAIKFSALLSTLYLIVLPFLIYYLNKTGAWHGSSHYILFLSIVAAITCLLLLLLLYKKPTFNTYIIYLTGCMVFFALVVNNSLIFIPLKSTKPLLKSLTLPLKKSTRIISYQEFNPDLSLYLQHPVYIAANWQALARSNTDTDINFFAHTCSQHLNTCALLISPTTLHKWWQGKQLVYAVVSNNKLLSFKQEIGEYHLQAQTPIYALVSNQ